MMATMEQTLASIFAQLELAQAAGDEQAVIDLLRRKDAICAMLVALESTWI